MFSSVQHCSCSQHGGGGTEVIGIGGDSSGSGDSGGATDNGGSDEVESKIKRDAVNFVNSPGQVCGP